MFNAKIILFTLVFVAVIVFFADTQADTEAQPPIMVYPGYIVILPDIAYACKNGSIGGENDIDGWHPLDCQVLGPEFLLCRGHEMTGSLVCLEE